MKRVRLLYYFLIAVLLFSSDMTIAQVTSASLGSGTSSSATRGPFQRSSSSSSSVHSRANLVYTQAEVATTLGIASGSTISQINWDLGSTNVITATGTATLKIYMKNSSAAAAVGDTWANITNGSTLVGTYTFDASTNNFPGVKGFMSFPLGTSFIYTGGSIEIAVEWDCSGLTSTTGNANELFSGNGSLNWNWDNTTHTSLVYKAGSSSAPSDLTTGNIKAERVNTQFVYTAGGGGGVPTMTSGPLGTGTSSSATRGPFQRSDTASSSVYSRANLVYTQAEVATTLGITSGSTISQINWDLGSTNVITATGTATLNIYMKNSSAAAAVGDTWANIISGSTLVGTYTFDATTNNFPGVKGFMDFPLAVPFVYTGNSIEVSVEWDCSGLTTTSTNPVNTKKLFSGNGSLNWHWDNTAHTSLIYRAGSSSAPSDLAPGSLKSQRVNTQFVYSLPPTPDSVDITFLVNTASITVDPTGLYVGGGTGFGGPTDNMMADTDGDGIWEVTLRRPKGFSSDYIFLNGNSGWGAKENLTGLPCAVAPWNDRHLPGVYSDTTLLTCYATCATDTVCPAPPADSVDITFLVNTANITVDPTGVFLAGGGNFGNPGDNPMTDADGDGIYEITVRKPEGFSSFYIFTNGNAGWGNKENLAGLPCGDPNNFNDRTLPGVWSDTTLMTCYETCATDTVCVAPLANPSLPITFQDTVTINHAIVDFGGNSSMFAVDPADPNNTVVKSEKTTGAQTWAGTVAGDNGLTSAIPFTMTDTKMSVRVWSPDANTVVRMKVEDTSNGAISVETEDTTTVAGGWETLTFDFANHVVGNALNLANTYDKVVMFFDFGNMGTGKTYYWDDIMMYVAPLVAPSLPLTFQDTVTVDHAIVDFGGNSSMFAVDPADPNNTVVKSEKTTGAQTWAGTVVGDNGLTSAIPFTMTDTKMSVRVWSPDANTPVRMKVEDTANGAISVETEDTTTVAGGWETLTFDFSNHVVGNALNLANTYDKVVMFFDFGSVGTGKTYYWDDIMMDTTTVVTPPTPDSVDITFLVNTANITVDPTGIFLAGGGNFGNPGDNPMTDADGDGVYEITVRKPEGFSSFYIFTNGNAGWGNKENLAGLPCGDPNNFNDRTLPGVWSDTTLMTCYETCAADTVCPILLAKPSLPITFEDTVTINQAITPFGGNSSHLVVDPTNAANTVLQSIKTTGAQTWAGTTMGGSGLASAIPFSATDMKMSVRVWSPDVNTPILLKVEDAANGSINSEVQVSTTVANAWETLVFDFSTAASPVNLANTYDKVSIFFDFGTVGSGKKYYCDDVMMYVAPVGATNDLILTALYDGPYSGGKPKGVEVYVVNNIADLSTYGIGTAQNGGGTDGQEYTFPAVSATAGTFLYVTNDSTGFADFFGFNADFIDNQGSSGTSAAMNFNGDDAVELYGGGQVIDLFGDIDMDGTGTAWEYLDTWVYRNCSKGPDTTFVIADWTISPINNFDGAANNAAATLPMPVGTYTSICPPPGDSVDVTFMVNTANITVDPTGMFIAGGVAFGVPGDNPMSDVDGDGIWEITVRKPEGFTSDYTFTNGNSGWGAKEDISGQPCAVAPFNDRNLPGVWSDTTLLTCFGSCVADTICPAPPATVDLTFTVDMSQYGSVITTANIFGSFNGWNNTANPLIDQGNNLWSATITVPENDSLEYKFVANGTQENLLVGTSCTKTTGAFTNRFLAYGNMNMAVDTVCWESCVACPTATPDSVDITFLVNTGNIAVDPTGVFLAGGGNFGNPGDNPMSDPDGDGIYEITVRKAEGFSSFYIFTNGNSGWGAKENLAGLPCGDPNNFNDRFLPGVWSDTTLMTCYETCATDTVCPTAPLDSVDITFLVNTANITVDPTGIFLAGGGNFGNPGDNPMADPDGDGIYEITVRKPEGFSSFYIFTNGNSGWGAKENLAGLPCGDPNNFNDRTLPGVWSDTTLMTCYETCATDTVCATPLAKPDLPITFQDTITINHAIGPFGGNSSHMVVDPTDPNNIVLQSIKTTGAQTWAGTTMGSGGLANAIPFTATEQKMSVRVWSPDANTPILLKVEDAANGGISSEVQVNTTVAGAWETLVFDFANGTPALNLTNTYDKVSIFFDFGNAGTGKKYYNDDVMMANTVTPTPDSVDITFLVNTANIAVDPTGIFLAGGGNFGNPGDNPMADPDGDGIYEITVRKPEGFSSFYIFTNGNASWNNKEDLSGLPCADPNNFNDRTLPGVWSDTTLLTCYETCATDTVCPAPPATIDIALNVDMSQYAGSFTTPYVSGNFNGWSGTANPMTDQGNGIWAAVITLPALDSIEYKFQVDNWNDEEVFVGGEPCTKTTGAFTNRFLAFGSTNLVVPAVCWESCAACVPVPSDSVDVTFQVDMTLETTNAGGVYLGADFEGWTGTTAMADPDNDDVWEVTVTLLKNASYEFKYINGPNWATNENFDPMTSDSLCTVTNGNVTNRIVAVGATDMTTTAYCYNHCVDCQSVGVEDVALTAAFDMMPNPANNYVRLEFSNEYMSVEKTITVYNSVGQQVFVDITNHVNTFEINTSEFSKGMYFITVQTEEGVQTKRLVIIH